MERYNVIVIGGGAAGLTVAGGAALFGARVALLERGRLGGDCLHYGCVPSKALLHVAKVAHVVRGAAAHAVSGVGPLPRQDLTAAMDYVRSVQARIAPHDSAERFAAMGVEIIPSAGRLRSAREVEIAATGRVIRGRHVVLATGSHPIVPAIPGLAEAGFVTNETVFDMKRLPEALLVVGGGPIGSELGQAFARLGSAVTIVNEAEHLLPREDADVVEVLARRLVQDGLTIWNRSTVARVDRHTGRKRALVTTPDGPRLVEADEILVCAGRCPAVDGLGLEAAGVDVDARGIRVDRAGRTSARSVWAVGDVTDTFRFTHWGGHQARVVVRNMLFPGRAHDGREHLPWTTFTDPEVARVGYSEAGARAAGVAVDVHRLPFAEVDRALCEGSGDGFVKVLTRRGAGTIVGAAIVHEHAGELIGELTLAQARGISLGALARVIHVYPTLAAAHGQLADAYFLGRVAGPRLRRLLTRLFAWFR
jgi:pyruvate/2-oxoglutarate dehydrogenase complex dihydrolipoamide dehydrogenase (E3) component